MKLSITIGLLLALTGCQKNDAKSDEGTERSVKTDTQSARPAADNTERNERDREPSALTPGDQGQSESDRNITQQIRQAAVRHDKLSMDAKNTKIITKDGVVTLRGPVENASEKALLAELAQGAPGVKRVDNQLEIKAQ